MKRIFIMLLNVIIMAFFTTIILWALVPVLSKFNNNGPARALLFALVVIASIGIGRLLYVQIFRRLADPVTEDS